MKQGVAKRTVTREVGTVQEPKENYSGMSVSQIAKKIRLDGETWASALGRASVLRKGGNK